MANSLSSLIVFLFAEWQLEVCSQNDKTNLVVLEIKDFAVVAYFLSPPPPRVWGGGVWDFFSGDGVV